MDVLKHKLVNAYESILLSLKYAGYINQKQCSELINKLQYELKHKPTAVLEEDKIESFTETKQILTGFND